jgi:hypothetical protein
MSLSCYPFPLHPNAISGMAVVIIGSETEAPSFSDLTKVNSDVECIFCQHMQQEL